METFDFNILITTCSYGKLMDFSIRLKNTLDLYLAILKTAEKFNDVGLIDETQGVIDVIEQNIDTVNKAMDYKLDKITINAEYSRICLN